MPESTATTKQDKLLQYIRKYIAKYGWAPTIRELAEDFSISIGAVQDRLAALESKGLLKRTGEHRGLEPADSPLRIPVLGSVGAGMGMIAQEQVERHVHFKDFLLGTDFLLRVKGDSMVGEGIMEGDLVQVRRQPSADDGDIVVAVVGGEEGVVKILRRTARSFQLESANPKYQPITYDFQVVGKVIGLVREYAK